MSPSSIPLLNPHPGLITCHFVCLSEILPMKLLSTHLFRSVVYLLLIKLVSTFNAIILCPSCCDQKFLFTLCNFVKQTQRNLASSTQSSTEHKPLPPSFRGRYDLATISLGWRALKIVRYFLVFLSSSFNSSFVQSMNATEYLRIDTTHVLIPFITLPP